ncbi:25.3 kDa vesicle transport protein SEC22-1 [Rutidosis leptorrhynchoides]|uniref:25.3 kDa vesicle transport protein SEC22-1 n=1 Tax=Rutidosis leptorrhynchoides TaxID=125765 RepID=UPI003A99CA3F
MVKLTLVARMNDGLPISQGPIDDRDQDYNLKKHAEFLIHEIFMASLPPSATTIFLHPRCCFNYTVKNGICFITLCDVSYPRKLAFHYLEDLQKEFEKFDQQLVNQITQPYTFLKFDNVIRKISRQYIDTRTQANLSKLNANHKQELDIITEQMATVVERRRRSDIMDRMMKAHKSNSPVWGSKTLEVIAVKWTPITVIIVLTVLLLWSSFKL